MNGGDLIALLPLIVAAASAVIVMLAIALRRSHRWTLALTLAGLAASLAAIVPASGHAPRTVTALLLADSYSLFFTALILAAALVVAMMSYGYLSRQAQQREEYYVLLILAALGAATLAWSDHFASFFLAVELLSVTLYALVAYNRYSTPAIEAGLKYLVLAGVSSPFLLFGMALVYADTGTMQLSSLACLATGAKPLGMVTVGGLGMIIVGVGFKLAVVPFHLWTPDVYQGAPAPVAAFIATASKGGMFALLLRYFAHIPLYRYGALAMVFTLIAAASMFVGNLLALRQNNLKRLLAYSSIAHLGYLLVAFLAASPIIGIAGGKSLAATAVTYYLLAYFAATLGAFGVITVLSHPMRDADALDDYRGLAWRRPILAAILTTMLLSLAGIPMTAGFIGKFYILAAGLHSSLYALVVILIITSVIGLYYYLRVIVMIYRPLDHEAAQPAGQEREQGQGQGQKTVPSRSRPVLAGIALAAMMLLVLVLGVYPSPALRIVQAAVAAIVP